MTIINIAKKTEIIRSFERIIFLYPLLLLCLLSSGQTYYFDKYATQEGLDASKVYTVIQDRDDYIWLGTPAGASLFDGIYFINYTIEDGMAEGGVRAILEDSTGNIWLGHLGGGLTRYSDGEFEAVDLPDTLLNNDVTSITMDTDGRLWLTTWGDGAYVFYNPDDKISNLKFEHFKGKRLSDRISNSLVTSDGEIYFVTDIGVKKYNKSENNFENYVPEGLSTFFLTTVIFEDSKKNLWFGTFNGGLIKYIYSRDTFKIYDDKDGLAANWISTISEDREGNIWVGHWARVKNHGGISRINEDGIKVFNTRNGMHDNWIYCIIEDKEGNILIGTVENGLEIFKGEQFVSFSTSNGLINDQVWAIFQDIDKNLWFGTNGGITVYNNVDTNKIFIHYNQANNYISNQIRAFKKDNNNNIWIFTADQGVLKYDNNIKSFVSQAAINNYVIRHDPTVFEVDKKNQLWIGSTQGLFQFNLDETRYIGRHSQEKGLAGSDISALYVDSENSLWVGSRNSGLTRMKDNDYKIYNLPERVTPTCIVEDKENKIWVGTEIKGVLVVKDSLIKRYSITDGLLSNSINLIEADDENNVYIGTNRGLNKIVQAENKIYTYTRKIGFTGIETKSNASLKDSDGNLWFGTINGVIKYSPELSRKCLIEPLTHIINMTVNGFEKDMVDGLKLRHNQNSIVFNYHSICLTNPEAVRYKIMLDGLDSDWQDVADQPTINYRFLPPKKYVFRVMAKNSAGEWNSEPIEYGFEILAPFYQRAWFIITASLLIITGIIMFIKIRERNLIREKRVLETKVKERTLALSEANEELALKNKDITDSIRYAKRIQLSILPPEIPFEDTFILFLPKDIVSGDFYWATLQADKEFFAAVDCTGHGVPGAFMSFIGYTSLNKIVIEQGIHEPAEILNHLNEEVAIALHQKGEEAVADGMDLALITYDPQTRELQYAGAFNPLLIINNGEITEIKANRFAIGRSTEKEMKFTNHKVKIKKGDIVYLYSDGYSDQFGGDEGKKFKTQNLKNLLTKIHTKSMEEQKVILENTYEEWKGNFEQIDDILVVGRRFS
ncbi:MAG: SpoIIE family protein phosphatase [Bacteroidales bacterium]|nr:MAG: SpoIIE family protein phosphatase [Bacteroidales bacterium]